MQVLLIMANTPSSGERATHPLPSPTPPQAACCLASTLTSRGECLFYRHCWGRHGARCDGNGENQPWVTPTPRNFVAAVFKPLDTDGNAPHRPGSLQRHHARFHHLEHAQLGRAHVRSESMGHPTNRFLCLACLSVKSPSAAQGLPASIAGQVPGKCHKIQWLSLSARMMQR